jgi:hypothetical protein
MKELSDLDKKNKTKYNLKIYFNKIFNNIKYG